MKNTQTPWWHDSSQVKKMIVVFFLAFSFYSLLCFILDYYATRQEIAIAKESIDSVNIMIDKMDQSQKRQVEEARLRMEETMRRFNQGW